MSVTTATGSKLSIGPVPAASVDTASEYAALTPYVQVGEVEDLGEFGDESNSVEFTSINDSRVRKFKGARDAGTMEVVVGRDPLNAGQLALKAAQKTKFEYAFKLEAADALSDDYTNSIYYFRGLVMSSRENYGGADNVVRTSYNIAINSEPLEVPSEEEP